MKRIIAFLLAALLALGALPAAAAGVTASLNQKIATRSGPSTAYDGTGTFLIDSWRGQQVTVLSKAKGDDVWWVLVDFTENGRHYRAYTGAQRVNVDINMIPDERMLGVGSMSAAGDVHGYFGPGANYAVMEHDVPWSVDVTVWAAENSYLLVDFYDEYVQKQRRAWVFADLVDVNWLYGAPQESIPDNQAVILPGDEFISLEEPRAGCTVLQYAQKGGYSVISRSLYGKASYPAIAVYMESADYGTFSVENGGGDIWFSSDSIFIDAYLPEAGVTDSIILEKIGT